MWAFVIIQFKADSTPTRIAEDAPAIIRSLQSLAKGPIELVLRTKDHLTAAWFIETDHPLAMIQNRVPATVGFLNGDAVLAFEVGRDFSGKGFSRAWTWLQRHPG